MKTQPKSDAAEVAPAATCSMFWLFRWHWLNLLWLLAGLAFFGWLVHGTIRDSIKIEGMLLGFILGFWFREVDCRLKEKQEAMRDQILSSNAKCAGTDASEKDS